MTRNVATRWLGRAIAPRRRVRPHRAPAAHRRTRVQPRPPLATFPAVVPTATSRGRITGASRSYHCVLSLTPFDFGQRGGITIAATVSPSRRRRSRRCRAVPALGLTHSQAESPAAALSWFDAATVWSSWSRCTCSNSSSRRGGWPRGDLVIWVRWLCDRGQEQRDTREERGSCSQRRYPPDMSRLRTRGRAHGSASL